MTVGKIQWFKFATDGPAHGIPSSLAFLFPLYVLLSDFELMASARIKVDVWILFAYVDEPKHLKNVMCWQPLVGEDRYLKLPTGPDACGYSQPTSVLAQDACPATPR
jgi:hypothetical protein